MTSIVRGLIFDNRDNKGATPSDESKNACSVPAEQNIGIQAGEPPHLPGVIQVLHLRLPLLDTNS